MAIGKENLLTGLWSRSRLNTRVILGLAMLYLLAIIFLIMDTPKQKMKKNMLFLIITIKIIFYLKRRKASLLLLQLRKKKTILL